MAEPQNKIEMAHDQFEAFLQEYTNVVTTSVLTNHVDRRIEQHQGRWMSHEQLDFRTNDLVRRVAKIEVELRMDVLPIPVRGGGILFPLPETPIKKIDRLGDELADANKRITFLAAELAKMYCQLEDLGQLPRPWWRTLIGGIRRWRRNHKAGELTRPR